MKIAVVGSGIAGLAAAYLLRQRHEVVLFEAAEKLGGHTYTVEVEDDAGTRRVDLGFIVCNDRTYPGFLRLLGELGVPTQPTSMSFSVRCEESGLEYNGSTIRQLFGQHRNVLSLPFHRMWIDILRFHRSARQVLDCDDDPTLGEVLARQRFGRRFAAHYLVPMTAAIWSTAPERILDFPFRTLAAFLDNHGMLTVHRRPQWLSIPGGSQRYVDAIARALGNRARTGCPVRLIQRQPDGVVIQQEDGVLERFDQVVIATHADQALRLLGDATAREREILGAISTTASEVVLHTDARLMPRRRRLWGSWNAHLTGDDSRVQVTYWMNLLQRLPESPPLFVTLNRSDDIDPRQILHRVTLAHPLFDGAATAAQRRWQEISGAGSRTHFAGAYWGYGFHEDGLQSGVRAARALGAVW